VYFVIVRWYPDSTLCILLLSAGS